MAINTLHPNKHTTWFLFDIIKHLESWRAENGIDEMPDYKTLQMIVNKKLNTITTGDEWGKPKENGNSN